MLQYLFGKWHKDRQLGPVGFDMWQSSTAVPVFLKEIHTHTRTQKRKKKKQAVPAFPLKCTSRAADFVQTPSACSLELMRPTESMEKNSTAPLVYHTYYKLPLQGIRLPISACYHTVPFIVVSELWLSFHRIIES